MLVFLSSITVPFNPTLNLLGKTSEFVYSGPVAISRQLFHLEGSILPSFVTLEQVVFLFIITIKIILVAFITLGSLFPYFLSRIMSYISSWPALAPLTSPLRS